MIFQSKPPLHPHSSLSVSKFYDDNDFYFDSGRSGLFTVIECIKEKHANVVFFIPAYTCPSVLDVLIQQKVDFDFVDICDDFDFDLLDLDILTEQHKNKKIALIATSLFGIKLRDYKKIFKDFIIIEDLAQSEPNNKSNSDFQFVSFGKGKLVSSWNGGLVRTKDTEFENMFLKLPTQDDFYKSYFLSNIQKIISKYLWFFIENSFMNPEKNIEWVKSEIVAKKISKMKKNWILTSLNNINTNQRINVSNRYLSTIKKEYLFNLSSNIPYLRLPIKKKLNFNGISSLPDYKYVYDCAKIKRNRDFEIPMLLVNECSFLPTHDLIDEKYVLSVIGQINE